jgi:uncharacterized protein (TIGR03085 family)
MSSPVNAERDDLVKTLRAVGPDAPTLCTGWTARVLVAHLIRRERSLVELGARVKLPVVTAAANAALQRYAASHEYPWLVDTFAAGAPRYSPFAFGPVAELANLLEYVVHHEDVRRAADEPPRAMPADREQAVFRRLSGFAKVTLRSAPQPVLLRTPDGRTITVGRGEPAVIVTGKPVELALVAFGRGRVANVDYGGDIAAIERFRSTSIGV